MDSPFGRPMQVHSVPPEERAYDSQGNQFPWALEWPEGHPNARGQRRHVDEKGPFGRATRRRGTSRTRTRTVTPAKKENLTLDGFEQALSFTLSQSQSKSQSQSLSRSQSQSQSQSNTPLRNRGQSESFQRPMNLYNTQSPSHHASHSQFGAQGKTQAQAQAQAQGQNLSTDSGAGSSTKQPTQVMIYGYSNETQWAALDTYEKASYGMFCEDYARTPPETAKRFPAAFDTPPHGRRALSRAERVLATKYDGGRHWVKITFDSFEAAERAIEHSPAAIYGHLVHAQLWRGHGPAKDEPIPVSISSLDHGEEEEEGGEDLQRLGSVQQAGQAGQAGQDSMMIEEQDHDDPIYPEMAEIRANSFLNPLPASPAIRNRHISRASPARPTPVKDSASGQLRRDSSEPSSSSIQLRRRTLTATNDPFSTNPTPKSQMSHYHQDDPQSGEQDRNTTRRSNMMTHFPDMPRTVLRPASEAFLPQMTWWERQLQWLASTGLIPGEIIGNGIPVKADGLPDIPQASFYWKFFHWLDSLLGTDFCGLKED